MSVSAEERSRWMAVFFAVDRQIAQEIDRGVALDKGTALAVITEFTRQLEKHAPDVAADLTPHYLSAAVTRRPAPAAAAGSARLFALIVLAGNAFVWISALPLYGKFLATVGIIASLILIELIRSILAGRRARRRSERGQVRLFHTRPPHDPSIISPNAPRHSHLEDSYYG